MTLRPAEPLDAGAAGAILSEFIDGTPWMPRLYSRAEDVAHVAQMIGRGWVTVAMRDGKVAGFLAREDGFVHALYVTGTARGAGLGTRLLQAAQGATDRLALWTFEANTCAQRFYQRHGFVEIRRTGGENDEGLPDIRYEWQSEALRKG